MLDKSPLNIELLDLIFQGAGFHPSDREERYFELRGGRIIKVVPIEICQAVRAVSGSNASSVLSVMPVLERGESVVFEYAYDDTTLCLNFSFNPGDS